MATRVQLDTFDRVKKAIDEMIVMLKQQQADEVKKVDFCKSEFHENEVTTAKTESYKTDLGTKIDDLGSTIQKLDSEMKQAAKDINTLQVELQRATENRQRENWDFQKTIADQRATQSVLQQASERLAKFYNEEELLQKHSFGKKKHDATQTPPVPQIEYKAKAGGANVMSMIEKLIYDARALEAESRKGEEHAQSQYETLLADTSASIKALEKEIAFKTGAKADALKEKTETESDLVSTVDELEGLDKYKGELHKDCDYMVKNFDVRQQARGEEIEALQQAKQVLSGAAQS
jgi:chromosome segregation ATPase